MEIEAWHENENENEIEAWHKSKQSFFGSQLSKRAEAEIGEDLSDYVKKEAYRARLKSRQNKLKSFFVGSQLPKTGRSRDVIECICKASAQAEVRKFLSGYDYKKKAHFRARVTNRIEYSMVPIILENEGDIVVNYGNIESGSLWTPKKPSLASLHGLRDVEALCSGGHPVAIWRYWLLKEKALELLSDNGYVQIREEQKEDGSVVKYPNYLLFLLICTPKKLNSLEKACESGRELLLSPFLAEKGAELLERCNYSQVSSSSLVSDLIHLKVCNSTLRKLQFKPLGRKPIQMKDYVKFDWYEVKSKIDCVKPHIRSAVMVNLVLQPQLRYNGGNAFFTLTVPNLSVDVEESIGSALKDWKCFPDSIKLTLKPLWRGSEDLVPTIKLNNGNRDVVKVINTWGMHKTIIKRRKANDSVEKVIEIAGAAGLEWKPNYRGGWHGGYDCYMYDYDRGKYDWSPYYGSPGCPDLNGMLEVEWALDTKMTKKGNEMLVEVKVDVGIQCLCFPERVATSVTHFVLSPELEVKEFCFSAPLNITLPSISSSSANISLSSASIASSSASASITLPSISSSSAQHETNKEDFEVKQEKRTKGKKHTKEDLEGCPATLDFWSFNSETMRKYVKSSRNVVDSLTDASPFIYFSKGKSMRDFLRHKDLMTRCKGLWVDFPLPKAIAKELGIALDGPLSHLVYLDLSHIGNDPCLFSFLWKPLSKPSSRLLYLDLSNNPIKPFKFSDAPNFIPCVQHLDLSNTQCNSYDTIIWRFPGLQYLNLSNNNTHHLPLLPSHIEVCPELRHLDLSNSYRIEGTMITFVSAVVYLLQESKVLSLNLQGNDLDQLPIGVFAKAMENECPLQILRL